MDYVVSDTLVLKIEEYESLTSKIDTTLYILFDVRSERYVIRGKRRDTTNIESKPYSFECESADNLAKFIKFILCSDSKLSYVLYNYDNLPIHSGDITYEFLNNYDNNEAYEITAYDVQEFKKQSMVTILNILRSVFNYY
jgi:hypothetical protein